MFELISFAIYRTEAVKIAEKLLAIRLARRADSELAPI